MNDLYHSISFLLTPFVLTFAVWVLVHFAAAAWRNRWPTQPQHWLVLGIVVGFVGKLFDNLYWGFAWSAYNQNLPTTEWYFAHGQQANIVFRQLALIASAGCHVVAAVKSAPVFNWRIAFGSALIGGLLFWLVVIAA